MKRLLDVIGTLLMGIGFFFAFLPHTIHVSVGLEEESHWEHVITGVLMLFTGLGILIYNNKALKRFGKS